MSATVSGQEIALWRNQAKQAASAANIPPAEVDWLLQEAAGLDSLSLRLESFSGQGEISLKQPLSALKQLWQRRLQERLPIQYLVGVAPWRHFSLKVTPDVLIPRPETELIIDIALAAVEKSPIADLAWGDWVDLGTGSGAIALGLAEVLTKATIHATDASAAALAIAQENATNLGLAERIHFYQGSWWSPLEFLKGKVSGMVSNPPYIPTSLISQLQPEVALHEPLLSLDGGLDGLQFIRHLVATSPNYIRPGGVWLIEMMAGQAETVARMLREQGSYQNIQIISDLAGIDRFALGFMALP